MKKLKLSHIILSLLIFFSYSVSSQIKTPNSFQDLKLRMKFSEFENKYPMAPECGFLVGLKTGLLLDGIAMYSAGIKTTISGDKVSVCVGFYNEEIVLIDVGYFDYVAKGDLIDGLKSKFGNYTNSGSMSWQDWINGQNRTTENYYWKNFPSCVLIFNYVNELGIGHIIYVDRKTQNKLKTIKANQNVKKID